MQARALKIAEAVIAKASRTLPADDLLRSELKQQSGLTAELSREISEGVFNFYRWLGWLNREAPLGEQLELANQLDLGFRQSPRSFTDEELVAKAVPSWVADEMEVTPSWVRALQTPPRLWLRARPGTASFLVEKLWDAEVSSPIADALIYSGRRDLFKTEEFQTGQFEVQDVSSQAVGLMCAPLPGETWWDACAGQGGKLLHLSDLMQNKGLIWASDRAEWRLKRLKLRTSRAKVFNYRAALWEGGAKLPTKTKFDGVLLDAPCSGIGTWQRNPHARWNTTLEDVRELATIQSELLERVAASVKPGGKLIYAVCTLARSETEAVAARLQERVCDLLPMALRDPFTGGSATQVWLRPEKNGGNGMFVAAWKKAG